MSASVKGDGASPVEIDAILGRIGAELGRLAETVKDLQSTLGPAIAAFAIEHDLIGPVQDFDTVEQTLRNLSTFMHGLGQTGASLESSSLDTLLARISLSALTTRLRAVDGPDLDPSAGSDLELF